MNSLTARRRCGSRYSTCLCCGRGFNWNPIRQFCDLRAFWKQHRCISNFARLALRFAALRPDWIGRYKSTSGRSRGKTKRATPELLALLAKLSAIKPCFEVLTGRLATKGRTPHVFAFVRNELPNAAERLPTLVRSITGSTHPTLAHYRWRKWAENHRCTCFEISSVCTFASSDRPSARVRPSSARRRSALPGASPEFARSRVVDDFILSTFDHGYDTEHIQPRIGAPRFAGGNFRASVK